MSIQYLSNEKGQVTAVQLLIEEWEKINRLYPNIDNIDFSLPEWHREILDDRLEAIAKNQGKIKPIGELFTELEK